MEALIRREKILSESKVREVFTPFSPIKKSELLSGREKEISSILSSINTPGQHALIYGNRGIGKSSLANVISEIVKDSLGYSVHKKKCSSQDTFNTLFTEILEAYGHNTNHAEITKEHSESSGASLSLPLFGGNLRSNKKSSFKIDNNLNFSSPSWIAETIKDHRCLVIIDEADMLKDDDDKRKLAELIKHLSDYGSSLKILIVGISDTGRNLVCNHRSLERCVNEISLQPILITALRDIIIKGSKRLGIIFHDDVIDDIVDISGGYPHFIHLIALKCAEEAIAIGSDKILPQDLEGSLSLAANFSEGGLKRNYEEAIKKNTKNSKKVLLAASLCHPKGFLVSELVEMTKEAIDPELKKSIITSCLSRWVKDESLGIILKVGRGHYKFSDPRFMSYIKMVNGITFDEGLLIADSLKNEYSKRYISNH